MIQVAPFFILAVSSDVSTDISGVFGKYFITPVNSFLVTSCQSPFLWLQEGNKVLEQWHSTFLPCQPDGQGPVHPWAGSCRWARSSHVEVDRSSLALTQQHGRRRRSVPCTPAPTWAWRGKGIAQPQPDCMEGRKHILTPS